MKKLFIVLLVFPLVHTSFSLYNPFKLAQVVGRGVKNVFVEKYRSVYDMVTQQGNPTSRLNTEIAALWLVAKMTLKAQGTYDSIKESLNLPPIGSDEQMQSLYNNHKKRQAKVRMSFDLGNEEKQFRRRRLDYVRKNLPNVFGDSAVVVEGEESPCIAVCASGGGFRAMIAALGLIKAMDRIKVDGTICPGMMDCVTYMSVLSGSSWIAAPWSLGKSPEALQASYEKYARIALSSTGVKKILGDALIVPQPKPIDGITKWAERPVIKNNYLRKLFYEEPVDMVDLYGALISHMVNASFDDPEILKKYPGIEETRQRPLFSQAVPFIEANEYGNRPLPISTAISPLPKYKAESQKTRTSRYLWLEFTPYEIGFNFYDHRDQLRGAWVPTWAFGRKFSTNQGFFSARLPVPVSQDNAPELPLGYLQATWGSAFGINLPDVIRLLGIKDDAALDDAYQEEIKKNKGKLSTIMSYFLRMLVQSIDKGIEVVPLIKNFRLYPGTVNNFSKDVKDSPLVNSTFVEVDAGIDFNLPIPPLLRKERKIDIIIVLDASAEVETSGAAIIGAEEYARAKRLPFPKIKDSYNYPYRALYPATVFDEYDEEESGPIVVYIPVMDGIFGQKGFSVKDCLVHACDTFNFDYSQEDVRNLSEQVKRTVLGVWPIIQQEVVRVVSRHKKREEVAIAESSH